MKCPLWAEKMTSKKEMYVMRLSRLCLASLLALTVSAPIFGQQNRSHKPVRLPVIVEGVRYEPDEVSRFQGQTMYWVYDEAAKKQGVMFGFTSPEAVQDYGRQIDKVKGAGGVRSITGAGAHGSGSCSYLHPAVNAGPNDPYDWIILCPLQQISTMRDGYNDRLSYVEAGSSSYYTVLYKCYNFSSTCDILWVAPGNTISDLNAYNMNNVASSVRFCRNVDPFSCLQ